MTSTECMNIKYTDENAWWQIWKRICKESNNHIFFSVNWTLSWFPYNFLDRLKRNFFLFFIIDYLSYLMVPKLVQFNEFEISMIRLTLSWNCPKYQAVTIKLEAFV